MEKTDIIVGSTFDSYNGGFITLTECEGLPNVWYHENSDSIFKLTPRGFEKITGSKSVLIKNGFIRKSKEAKVLEILRSYKRNK